MAIEDAFRHGPQTPEPVPFATRTAHPRSPTTLVLPRGSDAPRGLIAYQCAMDAGCDRRFPSYAMRAGTEKVTVFTGLPMMWAAIIGEFARIGRERLFVNHEFVQVLTRAE